jgi:hypothetical protein
MMEHRYSPRVEGALDVELSCRGRHLGRYQTRNISFEGMFLETGPVDLEPNDFLDLRLKAKGRSHSMRGFVVHRSCDGVGVMVVGEHLGYCRLILDAIDRGALYVPPESVGIGLCRLILDAIDGGALSVRSAPAHTPAAIGDGVRS